MLSGRVAVVTGGATGIGRAIAGTLLRAGAEVVIGDIATDVMEQAKAALADRGRSVHAMPLDVTAADSVRTFADRVAAEFGGIDILVNNAGIIAPRLVPLHMLTEDEFDRMLAVHLRGSFLMCRAAVPGMLARRHGRIVNISSIVGLVGFPRRAAYAVAKQGLVALTRTLALETARAGITVNAIAPGYILTDLLRRRVEAGVLDHDVLAERTPVGRWGTPEELAHAVAFLVGPGATYITGTVLPVDGGYSMRGDPGESLDVEGLVA